MALVASLLLVAGAAGPAAGTVDEPRRYLVDDVSAWWEIPQRREGRYRVFMIDAARYEDLESGEVLYFATADRMDCRREGDGLTCSSDMGPYEHARGKPSRFEFAHDLSSASVAFGARGVEHSADWTAYDAVERPFEFLPGTYHRTEGCDAREGEGRGVYRRMSAEGTVFGRDLPVDANGGIVAAVRFVLETECDPREWWRAATRPDQWLRRAEISSSLSMSARPSMPTSFAFS